MPQNSDHIKITDTQPRVQYVADGVKSDFPIPFHIINKTDLEVYIDEQKQSSNYTVSGEGLADGGVIILGEAPSAGAVVTLVRNTPIQRISDFQESGMFQAKVLNDELDVLTAALRDVAENVRRSIKLTVVDGDAELDLAVKGERANGILAFDADGNATIIAASENDNVEATPGGMDGQVQFNDAGIFGAAGGLTYAKSTGTLSVDGGVRADTITEKTLGAGVTLQGLMVKDGLIDGRDVSSDGVKLDGIEVGADVTDNAKVQAAGAVMNGDATTAAMQFVIDDDTMATATNTTVATSGSVKAYVDGRAHSDGDKGDITVSDAGASMTVGDNVVTNAKAADMEPSRIKGRIASGTGDPEDLTAAEVRAVADVYSTSQVDALTWDAGDIVSGAFADARISETSVAQHASAMDHDALANYVTNQHIDWTSSAQNFATTGAVAAGNLTVNGDITLTGTVAGRDVAADGAVLDSLTTPLAYSNPASVAEMNALSAAGHPSGAIVFVDQYAVAGDGGGGWFEARDSGDTVDNGYVFVHAAGEDMRWHRLPRTLVFAGLHSM